MARTAKTESTRQRALVLSFGRDEYDSYYHTQRGDLFLTVVTVNSWGEDIKGVSDYDTETAAGIQDGWLNNFRVTTYVEAGIRSHSDAIPNKDNIRREPWGEGYAYQDVYRVTLYDAERMAKVLKLVGKRLEQARSTDGAYASFGQYVARIAKAIGCTRILVPRSVEELTRRSSRWTDTNYVSYGLGDGAHAIDYRITQWCEQYLPSEKVQEYEARIALYRQALKDAEAEQAALPSPSYQTVQS